MVEQVKTFEQLWAEMYPEMPWQPFGIDQGIVLPAIFDVMAKWTEQFQ